MGVMMCGGNLFYGLAFVASLMALALAFYVAGLAALSALARKWSE